MGGIAFHVIPYFFSNIRRSTRSTLFPYTTLFRSLARNPSPGKARHSAHRNQGCAQSRGASASQSSVRILDYDRSEEHTSELQSHHDLVCRLLLEKKNKLRKTNTQKHKLSIDHAYP